MPAWCSSRTSSPATKRDLTDAPPPPKNACAQAENTTTSTMSATPRVTTPSSRCWATSPSATTSRSARSSSPGGWSRRTMAWRKSGCWSRSSPRTTRPTRSGARLPVSPKTASSASRPRTISGPWARPDPAARARRSSTITGPPSPADRRGVRIRTVTASSRSGTWCSCSSSRSRRMSGSTCPGPRSTPAWGSNASPRSCRAPTTTTKPTCSGT